MKDFAIFSEHHHDLLGRVPQDRHGVMIRKIAKQLHEELDVNEIVEQIWILHFVGLHVADRLLVAAGALAVSGHDGVLNQLALLTSQILNLILNQSPVHQVNEPSLDVRFVQGLGAIRINAQPLLLICIGLLDIEMSGGIVLDAGVAADVEVETLAAMVADDIGHDEDEAGLEAGLGFQGELLASDHSEQIGLDFLCFDIKRFIKSENMRRDQFREF